ncbi:MAG: cell division protein ZapA [Gammaproteobacteria bacterium]|nr:cell division protein ZapA [Gammaproteobacteria bacterium]
MSVSAASTGRSSPVNVRILEKDYQIACSSEERPALMRSAEVLNQRMREIRDGGNIIGLDRIAVMAALNLAAELLKTQDSENKVDDTMLSRVQNLTSRVEQALERGQQLEI